MITGDIKQQVDRVWDAFWSGGISNPITVIEQFTYLLFMRQLDRQQNNIDQKRALGAPVDADEDIFPEDKQHLRWSHLVHETDPQALHRTISQEAFPFIRTLGGQGFQQHLQNASFSIESPATLKRAVELIDKLEMRNKDLTGDLYEYMLSKLSASGTNGQFRTPSHIIELMVALMNPTLDDRVIDPACGTAGFLVGAGEWAKEHDHEQYLSKSKREHFYSDMFHGYDFDSTMVRIAAMNMFMHGMTEPKISYRDTLLQMPEEDRGAYSLILANPPFAGSTADEIDGELKRLANTKKTELLFIARFLTLLEVGGRAAVIVPEGVLFGSSKAHKSLREELVERQKLDAVIKLPSGTFKPYSGVSTAILCFTKTDSGGTDDVWFYDVRADGYSLDDKRTPLLDAALLGPTPHTTVEDPAEEPEPVELSAEQLEKNNLPDVLARWSEREGNERERARTEQSFTVSADDIREAGYDLSMNRYKEIVFEAEETRDPKEIIAEIRDLDREITAGLDQLEQMLGDK